MSEVIDTTGTEVTDLPVRESHPLAVAGPAPVIPAHYYQEMESLGFITPLADPARLRQFFAYQQQIYAAILDTSDYIYTVSFPGSEKTLITKDLAHARKTAEEHNGTFHGSPTKGGVTKLAKALGITAKRFRARGLPEEAAASYAYVEYEALHEGTGRKEIGVGWCDRQERRRTHDIIATADTRAYCRAVLRLAGFGEVAADEIVAGASDGEELPEFVPETKGMRDAAPRPDTSDPMVTGAASAWAEAVSKRPGPKPFQPSAQQSTQAARELRARARRGDTHAAAALGAQGLEWAGVAQDGVGVEPWEAGPSPVSPEQFRAAAMAAAAPAASPSPPPTVTEQQAREQEAIERVAQAAAGKPPTNGGQNGGWDLSSKGSQHDDIPAADTTAEESPHKIPKPDLGAPTIAPNQARNATTLVLELCNQDRPSAGEWIRAHCWVGSLRDLRANQYEKTMDVLKRLVHEKKEGK